VEKTSNHGRRNLQVAISSALPPPPLLACNVFKDVFQQQKIIVISPLIKRQSLLYHNKHVRGAKYIMLYLCYQVSVFALITLNDGARINILWFIIIIIIIIIINIIIIIIIMSIYMSRNIP